MGPRCVHQPKRRGPCQDGGDMIQVAKRVLKRALGINPPSLQQRFPEASDAELAILKRVAPYTMTSPERLWGLVKAIAYVSARKVPGDFVECGVWRGGSSMAAALAFKAAGDIRRLWLYDTFEGMPAPTERDRKNLSGLDASREFRRRTDGEFSDWCRASLEDVQANLGSTGYTDVEYIQGKVENTLPHHKPERISVLRLDTDWYDSTKIELQELWPRLSTGGVLILDDYGCWSGAKQAADEFFASQPPILMNRLDSDGRLILKT